MHLTMQTVIANVFAATATVVVLAFPAPSDLKEAIFGAPDRGSETLQLIDFQPSDKLNVLGEGIAQTGHYIALLNDCAHYLSRTLNPETALCREVVESIRQTAPALMLDAHGSRLDPLGEALRLASAQLCRVEWGREPLANSNIGQFCLN